MKKLSLIICFLLANLSQISMAQNASIFGLELGMCFSQFPNKSEWNEIAKSGMIEIDPLISPLLGVTKDWIIFKHFQITFGAQYHMSGYRKYEYTEYTWPVINDYFENWEKIKIHKFCLPITLGYTFKINKVKPSIYFGMRPNYIFSANKYSKQHIHNEPDRPSSVPQDEYSEENMNLYDYTKRMQNQLCVGISTPVGQNVKINLSYNLGRSSYTVVTDWGYGAVTETTDLPDSDYVLSIQYNFIRPEGKK